MECIPISGLVWIDDQYGFTIPVLTMAHVYLSNFSYTIDRTDGIELENMIQMRQSMVQIQLWLLCTERSNRFTIAMAIYSLTAFTIAITTIKVHIKYKHAWICWFINSTVTTAPETLVKYRFQTNLATICCGQVALDCCPISSGIVGMVIAPYSQRLIIPYQKESGS